MRRIALILQLLSCCLLASTQVPVIRFQHLTPEEGLSQGHVLCMLQDKEGYIWMGTYYGLNRYNGYSFKLFSKIKGDSTSIVSDVIYSLYEDKDGYIWVGTVSGLDKFDKKTETFKHFPTYKPGGINDGYIRAITQDIRGNIWVATSNGGLNRIDAHTNKVTYYTTSAKGESHLLSNTVTDLHIDKSNQLWIATEGGGLSLIDLQTNRIKSLFPFKNSSVPWDKISCIFEDHDGRIWIGNSDGKLALFNRNTNDFTSFNYLPTSFNSLKVRIRDISQDKDGYLLIATMGAGLVIFNPQNGHSAVNQHNLYNSSSISANETYSLLVDRTWTVFVGTYGRGVSFYSPYNLKFPVHFIETNNSSDGDVNSYTSCVQDSKGRLIVGTYNGFYVINKSNWEYKHYAPGKNYSENKILIITIAPDSSIWIGTDKGLHQYDKEFNKIATYNLLDDNLEHPIYSIYFDHTKNMWLGLFVDEGLAKIPESEWMNKKVNKLKFKLYKQNYQDTTSLYGNQVWCIKEDKNHNLWIGTNIGICKYNPDKDNFRRYYFTSLCKTIDFDKNNNMWIATRGEGVFCYHPASGNYEHYTTLNGLCQNFVFGVIPDNYQQVWLSSENGLSKFDLKTRTFRNYDLFDGLPNNRFDDRSEKLLPDGQIYLGTGKGFTIFDPLTIKDDTSRANVIFTNIKILNSNAVYDHKLGKDNKIPMPVGLLKEIEFYSNQRDFSIEFAALHYSAPHKIRYKYRLKNFDADWIETRANNRIARYTNLDGGTYIFSVMATNGDGVWNTIPTNLIIIIHPPFIETWYFRFVIIMVLGIIVFAYFRWRIKREHKQNMVLAKMVKDRTHEITEKNNLLEEKAKELNLTNSLLELRQRDIEAQKEELATQRDKLVESNATKDKLFSIIAHDLKNPFNVIIGFSDLIIDNYHRYTDERRLKMASQINQASRNAFQLLENLLEWSRSQKGSLIYSPVVAEISVLLKTAYNHVKEFARNKEIQIEGIEVTKKSKVFVDINMMNTILRNLLNNAVKFSNVGSTIMINIQDFDDLYMVFSIKDSGIGMPEEIRSNLFKLDKKVNQSGTAGEPGTGLGLLICKDFIEAHNGRIWVETIQGKGTTFYFTVPKVL